MFNVRPDALSPWLYVEPLSAGDVPGFRMNPDGSVRDTQRGAPSTSFGFNPSTNPSPPMGTDFQDALRFAPGDIYPDANLSGGLPDFAPPPRNPLQDALNQITRIYAPFAPRASGPVDRRESGINMVSPIGNWPVSSYASQTPVPVASPPPAQSDGALVTRGPLDATSYSSAEFEGISPLPKLDSAEAPGPEQWPSSDTAVSPTDINTSPLATTAPTPEATIENAWSQRPTNGWPYAESGSAAGEVRWPMVVMSQTAGGTQAPSVQPAADSNFILANAGDADDPQAEPRMPLPQGQPTELANPVTPTGLPGRPPELRTEQALSRSIEDYRRTTADEIEALVGSIATFGSRIYEDSILKARDDLARLAERLRNDPGETALSILNSFPQTRVEGKFVGGLAAVLTILANAKRGLEFERTVLHALSDASQTTKINKNTSKIGIEGLGRSVSLSTGIKMPASYFNSGPTTHLASCPTGGGFTNLCGITFRCRLWKRQFALGSTPTM